MSQIQSSASSTIRLSEAAAAKITRVMAAPGNENLKLRIYIEGGGCSGFQYQIDYESEVNSEDILIHNGAVTVLTDPLSAQYLKGAEIDYVETLQHAGFMVKNPNAATTCGCGSSFSLKDEEL